MIFLQHAKRDLKLHRYIFDTDTSENDQFLSITIAELCSTVQVLLKKRPPPISHWSQHCQSKQTPSYRQLISIEWRPMLAGANNH